MREFAMRTTDRVEFTNGLYVAELAPLSETTGWQEGSIDPGELSDEQLGPIIEAMLDSLGEVDPAELAFSDCTDSRYRLQLQNGLLVPNRQKLVGADTVTALVMAESLGRRFYGNDKATPAERVDEVTQFLLDNGIMPSTHGGCGAAGGFVAVLRNAVRFSVQPNFQNRQRRFVPVFDQGISDKTIKTVAHRLDSGLYEGYSDNLITDAVLKYTGPAGIAQYRDDGRGVKGHTELLIARIEGTDEALDVNALADATNGGQAFSVNDTRLEKLASLFGRGHDEDYVTAYTAGEAFSDAGHGTLGRNLRTVTIRKAA